MIFKMCWNVDSNRYMLPKENPDSAYITGLGLFYSKCINPIVHHIVKNSDLPPYCGKIVNILWQCAVIAILWVFDNMVISKLWQKMQRLLMYSHLKAIRLVIHQSLNLILVYDLILTESSLQPSNKYILFGTSVSATKTFCCLVTHNKEPPYSLLPPSQ